MSQVDCLLSSPEHFDGMTPSDGLWPSPLRSMLLQRPCLIFRLLIHTMSMSPASLFVFFCRVGVVPAGGAGPLL